MSGTEQVFCGAEKCSRSCPAYDSDPDVWCRLARAKIHAEDEKKKAYEAMKNYYLLKNK